MKNRKPNFFCIVDDDKSYQFLAKLNIKKAQPDASIMTFLDGEDAYNYLEENKYNIAELPDIILLDLNMPFMDGWSFLAEYKNIAPELKKEIVIYVVSASSRQEDQKRANEISEVFGYKVKPVTVEEVNKIIEEIA